MSRETNTGTGRPGPNKNRSFGNQSKQLRKNERIRVPEVRVIGPDGSQVGVLQTREAIKMAKAHGLDLVEVSPMTTPPVCRILDFGKYMYEESKKQKGSKPATTKLKEIKFRLNIDQHDYETKMRHAEEFLDRSNRVKLTLAFRGREMEHKELGFNIVKRAIEDLSGMGQPDCEPRLMGRNISLTIMPHPQAKRKRKFQRIEDLPDDEDEGDDDSED